MPSGDTATAALSNCASVKKTYPFGIALDKKSVGTSRAKVNRNKYIQLKYLDKDLDGIVCETEKLQTKITTSTTTPRTTTVPVTTTTTVPVTTTTTVPVTTTTLVACASGGLCRVGDRGPGGGYVFYDAGSTQPWGRYLEVAPSDLGTYQWNDAMNAAQSYAGGGLSGWRLPTKDELNSLCQFRLLITVGGFSRDHSNGRYWSSSEGGLIEVTDFAWTQFMTTCYQEPRPKTYTTMSYVRPVRAF